MVLTTRKSLTPQERIANKQLRNQRASQRSAKKTNLVRTQSTEQNRPTTLENIKKARSLLKSLLKEELNKREAAAEQLRQHFVTVQRLIHWNALQSNNLELSKSEYVKFSCMLKKLIKQYDAILATATKEEKNRVNEQVTFLKQHQVSYRPTKKSDYVKNGNTWKLPNQSITYA